MTKTKFLFGILRLERKRRANRRYVTSTFCTFNPKEIETHLPFDHLGSDVSLDDVTLPHVTDTEHQTGLSIPLTDHSVP